MNEIIGIDPVAPSDIKDLKSLLEMFGLSNGRFIANYPADWELILRQNLNQLKDIDKARATRLLDKHRDATLPVDGDYKRSKDWAANAVELQGKGRKFSEIYSTSDNPYKLPALEALLWDDDQSIPDGRGAHLPMTVESYRKAAKPLFLQSTEVHLIDSYFSLRRDGGEKDFRRWKVLSGFFEEAKNSGRCTQFCMHVNGAKFPTDSSINTLVLDLEQIRDEVNYPELELSYTVEEDKLHGRYLFSIKGGLQFDYGFDTDTRNLDKRNHIHWLSATELEPLLNTI